MLFIQDAQQTLQNFYTMRSGGATQIGEKIETVAVTVALAVEDSVSDTFNVILSRIWLLLGAQDIFLLSNSPHY